ncbi:hypothetical protein T310_1898 [Rasamsonia emersonii CBS 393.64]|uniref:Uncharacterized protein n=1 Tax=Rasamsonia emersonii (strain ATCC 16479 / CBS 393.64 / IMI 116815) TaxID=1408163 RepID=A0A0F4Z1W1_RASE3|nr:hypothetical protein T310_1898 [Rasamsonia emersonii CBS 393.64]KKA24086.1 hypothetical protein T310_1898 [Rasamsonia emersonii CBS 393.64]
MAALPRMFPTSGRLGLLSLLSNPTSRWMHFFLRCKLAGQLQVKATATDLNLVARILTNRVNHLFERKQKLVSEDAVLHTREAYSQLWGLEAGELNWALPKSLQHCKTWEMEKQGKDVRLGMWKDLMHVLSTETKHDEIGSSLSEFVNDHPAWKGCLVGGSGWCRKQRIRSNSSTLKAMSQFFEGVRYRVDSAGLLRSEFTMGVEMLSCFNTV